MIAFTRFTAALLIGAAVFCCGMLTASAQLGPTLAVPPPLPRWRASGYVPVDGVRIWYAQYGSGPAVLLLEGGEDPADDWSELVPVLDKRYRVIVLDTRCQGRSTCSPAPLSYHLFARDVLGVMDRLGLGRAALIGWSDGAIVGLDLAIHHPQRLSGLFAYGANSSYDAVVANPKIDAAAKARADQEDAWDEARYVAESPTPRGWKQLDARMQHVWATQPNFTRAQLASIRVPTWIVDGDREAFIPRSDTDMMATTIPHAAELIVPNADHYAMWEQPQIFDAAVETFLATR